jgi:hypothetical protein
VYDLLRADREEELSFAAGIVSSESAAPESGVASRGEESTDQRRWNDG